MPPSDAAERSHHLRVLRTLITEIHTKTDRGARVQALRQQYDSAGTFFDQLIAALPRTVRPQDKEAWRDRPLSILERYAVTEDLW